MKKENVLRLWEQVQARIAIRAARDALFFKNTEKIIKQTTECLVQPDISGYYWKNEKITRANHSVYRIIPIISYRLKS